MLGPRNKGLAFTTPIRKFYALSVEKTIEVDGVVITGIKVTHGPLTLKFGPVSKTIHLDQKKELVGEQLDLKLNSMGKQL